MTTSNVARPRAYAELLILVALLVATPLRAQAPAAAASTRAPDALGLWDPAPSPLVATIRDGIDAYYRFDYAVARAAFDRVVAARPDHPVGYFLRAEASWWQFLNDRRNEGARERLLANLEETVRRAEDRLEEHPDDVETLFVLGSAHGRLGMLAGTRKDAWDAARSARRAKNVLDRVQALEPGNVDAAAAEGLYLYYVGTFGSVTRAASRLLFGIEGDKRAGLVALDKARRNGVYTRTEAGFFQGLFYLQYEDRPDAARPILDRLRARYPENLYFATMAAYARQRQGEFHAASELYRRTLDRVRATGAYGPEGESVTRLFYGQTLLGLGDLAAARDQFVRVVQLRTAESDAYPHAYLYLGRLADLRGEREIAERYYRRVLELPDAADSHDAASDLLDRPFARSQVDALVQTGAEAR